MCLRFRSWENSFGFGICERLVDAQNAEYLCCFCSMFMNIGNTSKKFDILSFEVRGKNSQSKSLPHIRIHLILVKS